jgi:hypothetical protein
VLDRHQGWKWYKHLGISEQQYQTRLILRFQYAFHHHHRLCLPFQM